MIYDPQRRRRIEPKWQNVSGERPLRCVASLEDPGEPSVASWLAEMKGRYRLKSCRQIVVDMAERNARPRNERYYVYELVPLEWKQPGT
jgi:hypothetical protein